MASSARPVTAGLVVLALLAGLAAGYLLAREGAPVDTGLGAASAPAAQVPADDSKSALLAKKLGRSDARVRELETALAKARAGAANATRAEPEPTAEEGWAAEKAAAKRAAKGKGGRKKGKGAGWGKGRGGSSEPPEGMTREEWDAAVRVIVDGHDWRGSLSALRRLSRAKSSGQPMDAADLERWEAMQEAWQELGELGVGRNDPRVLRATVPAWASALGANLDDTQTTQLGQTVETIAEREAVRPAPEVPERFATYTARQLRYVIEFEDQMAQMLNPGQLQACVAEVGDDPFASGWRTKPWQMTLTGSADEISARARGHWSNHFDITDEERRAALAREATAFTSAALAIPGPAEGLDAASRRRAILDRTARIAELQGAAEHRLLTIGIAFTDEEREVALGNQAPIFIVPGQ